MTVTRARAGLLSEPDFRRWYLSRSVSVAGTAGSAVALPLLVYSTSSSAGLTAAVVGLEALPYLVLGLIAGAAADRRSRRAMMIQADVVNAVLLATVPVAGVLGVLTVWHVLAVALGVGAGFCWFDAAAWGALPRLVGKAALPRANSLIWATAIVIGIVAPALAGVLATWSNPRLVVALDALTYVGSAVLIARVRTELTAVRADADRARLRRDITDGLRFISQQPVIRALTYAGFGLSLAGGGALGLFVVHADQALSVDADDWRVGVLYTAGAIGALCAAWALRDAGRRLGEGVVSIGGYLLFLLALCGLAAARSPLAGLLLWAVWDSPLPWR